jgi:hypothetical protein
VRGVNDQDRTVPLFDSEDPPRELIYAIEHLADDYGLDAVRAAVVELVEWYARDA